MGDMQDFLKDTMNLLVVGQKISHGVNLNDRDKKALKKLREELGHGKVLHDREGQVPISNDDSR